MGGGELTSPPPPEFPLPDDAAVPLEQLPDRDAIRRVPDRTGTARARALRTTELTADSSGRTRWRTGGSDSDDQGAAGTHGAISTGSVASTVERRRVSFRNRFFT